LSLTQKLGKRGRFAKVSSSSLILAQQAIERFKWTHDEFGSLDVVQSEHIFENHYKSRNRQIVEWLSG